MLSPKTQEAIVKLQELYLQKPLQKRSALIPALHLAQNEVGYLPLEVQEIIATLFCIDFSEVHAIVSFYDMFHEEPIGRHCLHVCKNASCMLRGSDELIAELCKKLDISPGETSKDGEFTVIPSECLGACDLAPMMIVDEEVVGPIYLEELDNILQKASEDHHG
jgi:NADH-quinone oxidoreductase subunit E